jgi:hypothetical protein
MHFTTDNTTQAEGSNLQKGTRNTIWGASATGEMAQPSVQFVYPEHDLQLPFPNLNSQRSAPTIFPEPRYEGHPPNLFNVRIDSDDERYPLEESDGELVSAPSSPELKPIRMSAATPAFGTSTRTV